MSGLLLLLGAILVGVGLPALGGWGFFQMIRRANFPAATVEWIDSSHGVIPACEERDFVFIPTSRLPVLPAWVDVAANTESLAEMRAPTVRRFVKLIGDDFGARYFYSCNRQLSTRDCSPDCDPLDLPALLGRVWETLLYAPGPANLGGCFPDLAERQMLELLVRRNLS